MGPPVFIKWSKKKNVWLCQTISLRTIPSRVDCTLKLILLKADINKKSGSKFYANKMRSSDFPPKLAWLTWRAICESAEDETLRCYLVVWGLKAVFSTNEWSSGDIKRMNTAETRGARAGKELIICIHQSTQTRVIRRKMNPICWSKSWVIINSCMSSAPFLRK